MNVPRPSFQSMLRSTVLSGENEQVVLWGEAADLAALSNGLRAQAAGVVDSSDGWLPRHIHLTIREPAEGMSRDGEQLRWRIAPRDAFHFADLIDELVSTERDGHQYLDVDVQSGFGTEVKISLGEYPENFPSR
jgi:hypothetical protein